jgi:enoyl-CoA hydratase/carnithine racemase
VTDFKSLPAPVSAMAAMRRPLAGVRTTHVRYETVAHDTVAVITLDRPDRKNPLTFASYAELRDLFRDLVYATDVRAVVLTGSGGNFCSGGDVFEIIEPLTRMTTPDLLAFTRLTGDLIKAMRACPQPIIAAVDGVAAGAGAILAMASDMRLATPAARTAFLFTRVGLAGCDMGACALLPRLIGQGRRPSCCTRGARCRPTRANGGGSGIGSSRPNRCVRRRSPWRRRSRAVRRSHTP